MPRAFFSTVTAIAAMLLMVPFAHSAPTNMPVSYHGRIIKPNGSPLQSSAVQFKIQIRSPGSESCLMYEETQVVNMTGSAGVFTLSIASGAGTRTDTGTYKTDQIFANRGTFTFGAGECTTGTTYTPTAADGRKLQVFFKDGSGAWEAAPTETVRMVPQAIEARQVGGFTSSSLLRVENASGPQDAAPLSPANFTELQALIGGTSSQYEKAGRLGGVAIPTGLSADESIRWNGSTWEKFTAVETELDPTVKAFAKANLPSCSVGQVLTGDGTTMACVSQASVGDASTSAKGVVQIGASGGLSISGGTLVLGSSGVTAGTYQKVTVDAYGRVTAGAALSTTDIPALDAAKVASGTFASSQIPTLDGSKVSGGTIGGSTALVTSGAVSAASLSSQSLYVWDSDNTNKVTIQAPATGTLTSDYVLKLPADDGGANQLLQTDGSGNLSWVSGNSGSVTSVGLSLPSIFSVSGGPVTSSGTISATLASQTQNTFFAAPDGSSGAPAFRAMVAADVPSLDAAKVATGTFASAQIPALSAAKITSGTFAAAQIPDLDAAKVATGTFASAQIPALSASKITSGSFAAAQIPDLDAAKIATGTLATAQIPDLDAAKIATGTISAARLPSTASAWTVSGSNVYRNSGNVGIGTTNPGSLLTVSGGDIELATAHGLNLSNRGILLGTSGYANALRFANGGGTIDMSGGGTVTGNNGTLTLKTGTGGGNVLFQAASTERMRIDASNGYIGIGTTAPAAALDVNGAVRIANDATACSATNVGAIRFNGTSVQYCVSNTWTSLSSSSGDNLGNHTATANIQLGNYWLSGDGGSEGVFVTSAGNVGIGTSSPMAPFWAHLNTNKNIGFKINNNESSIISGNDASNAWAPLLIDASVLALQTVTGANVGIGTTAPVSLLDVNGVVSAGAGASNAPSFAFRGDPDTGLYSSGTNELSISAGNTRTFTTNSTNTMIENTDLYIKHSWNGTYTPTSTGIYTPSLGSVSFESTASKTSSGMLNIFHSKNDGGTSQHAYFGTVSAASGNTPYVVWGQRTGATAFNERMRLDLSGNLGIGVTAPAALLDVNGAVRIANDATACSSTNAGAIRFNGTNVQYCVSNTWTSLASGTSTQWTTAGSNIGYTSGNVGIGTTAPVARFDVNGTARVTGSTAMGTSGAGVEIQYASSTGSVFAYDRSTSTYKDIVVQGLTAKLSNGAGNGVFVDTVGKVGVGTTAPGTQLDVAGVITANSQGTAANQGGEMRFRELAANGANYAALRVPDALAADYTLTLPVDDGTSNQVLTTDGSGVLSWTTVSGGSSGTFRADNGTAAIPTHSFTGDTNTGMYNVAADTLGFSTNNTNRLTIDSSGNVGIGTTSPGAALSVVKNNAGGNIARLQNTAVNGWTSFDMYDDGGYLKFGFGYGNTGAAAWAGSAYFDVQSTTPFVIAQNTVRKFEINSSGNIIMNQSAGKVGIGTTAPSTMLDIQDAGTNTGIYPLRVAANTGAGPGKYVSIAIDNQTSGAWKQGIEFRNSGTAKYSINVDAMGSGATV